MRPLIALALILPAASSTAAPHRFADDAAVMAPVRAFYRAYDEGFPRPATFATADWNHINPVGGRSNGRDIVLAEVREVHRTFLKGVTDTIESFDVRFASPDVAVATVVSLTSRFVMPGEKIAAPHRQIRTFVLVRRGRSWLVMQDHNTNVAGPTSEPQS